MRKEDFLKKMEELKPKLKNIVVEVDESLPADYAIGCYFEKKDHTWRVYSKTLPDKSNKLDIELYRVTYSEGEAFDKLYEMMMKEIEIEEESEHRKEILRRKQREKEAKMSEEEREQLRVDRRRQEMENVFYYNCFGDRRIGDGDNRVSYLEFHNTYCQVRYIKEKRAFVIVSADSKEDAIKGNLKIGTEYYYMDEPEKEMLHRLDEDVMTNYMK